MIRDIGRVETPPIRGGSCGGSRWSARSPQKPPYIGWGAIYGVPLERALDLRAVQAPLHCLLSGCVSVWTFGACMPLPPTRPPPALITERDIYMCSWPGRSKLKSHACRGRRIWGHCTARDHALDRWSNPFGDPNECILIR